MKRKFKQWWSTIPPISTKQAFTSDLNTLNMKKRLVTMIYDVRNPGPGLGIQNNRLQIFFSPHNDWLILMHREHNFSYMYDEKKFIKQ
jgi:hypothetical protein